jgi:hypothetical protein
VISIIGEQSNDRRGAKKAMNQCAYPVGFGAD